MRVAFKQHLLTKKCIYRPNYGHATYSNYAADGVAILIHLYMVLRFVIRMN